LRGLRVPLLALPLGESLALRLLPPGRVLLCALALQLRLALCALLLHLCLTLGLPPLRGLRLPLLALPFGAILALRLLLPGRLRVTLRALTLPFGAGFAPRLTLSALLLIPGLALLTRLVRPLRLAAAGGLRLALNVPGRVELKLSRLPAVQK
jgi:hypothetical protein